MSVEWRQSHLALAPQGFRVEVDIGQSQAAHFGRSQASEAEQHLVRPGMPVLVDDDLLFEDRPGSPRPAVVANQWLRELPTSGAPSLNI